MFEIKPRDSYIVLTLKVSTPGMPVILHPAKAAKVKRAAKTSGGAVSPREVVSELEKHILVDGFKLVFDPEKSRGSRFVDAATGRELIDLYGFYASQPIGFNHPHFDRPEVQADLLKAAKVKVSNADIYTVQYATFVQTFARVVGLPPLERYFFIEGGALAVENALKAAMDWKVRKNLAAGRAECGTEIIHFERAFHGRTGYTLSLTNTEPRKTERRLSLNRFRAKAEITISGANSSRYSGRFAMKMRCCSFLTRSKPAWVSRAGTGVVNTLVWCPTCWLSEKRRRSVASWPAPAWTK